MMGNETNEIIEEILISLQRYQEGLKERMRGTEIVFDSAYLLHHNFHKANSD